MPYKMIVLDIDDTLLNDNYEITKKTKDALLQAQKNGITVVLCSGRPTSGMYKIADTLELKENDGYIISYNGANILDYKNDKMLYEKNLTVSEIHRLYDLSLRHNVGIHTYFEDEIIATEKYKYTMFESELTGIKVHVIDDFKKYVDRPVVKAIMVDEPEILKGIEKPIREELKDEMHITFSKPFFLEFMKKGINKGSALTFLMEQLNISKEEVIAFGDSFNDIQMLEVAGTAVCMENGHKEVKDIADFITLSNNEDGIWYALEKFL